MVVTVVYMTDGPREDVNGELFKEIRSFARASP